MIFNCIIITKRRKGNRKLAERVIPGLALDRPTFLLDFPDYEASLARRHSKDPRVVERLELFISGLELANGFSELNDIREQRLRFDQINQRRKDRGARQYPMPEKFLACLERLPPCAGIALGVDRMVMLFTNSSHIEDIVALGPVDL